MNKKFKFILMTLLVLLSLLFASLFINHSAKLFNNQVTESENKDFPSLSEFKFDEGVVIDNVKTFNDDYLAFGEKDSFPYMQIIKNTKDNFVLEDIKTDFKSIKGKIIDVVDNSHYITAKIQEADKVVYQNFFISNDKIIPYYKKQLNMNYSKGVKNKVKYLVIHETANENEGADASAHYKYWSKNSSAKASTHFVVDSNEIYQMLELNQVAWHVGDNKGYSEITNTNSIGIEIAVNSDGNYIKAREHAIELTVQLMRELNMDISQLKRHYDASGKNCPAHILSEKFWDEFVNQVKVELEK